ncbi:hypothetical protein Y032_1102g3606 [Ancylostoma ceylanicum]|uniref:sphingomyelin phosphodiesterase n=1 Tax=Ancylostoma ceylanicum TaxID=53326 RepID=A0A016W8A8_9BILA|nr:hypothetical protein Y032_1102g3606 [Ancylostoma ceylanicum]
MKLSIAAARRKTKYSHLYQILIRSPSGKSRKLKDPVVGLVELEVGEIRVNFYTTHLHAEYDRENDLYLPHRTSQSFELSQFIRHTAHGADVVIVTGDLNMEPDDLGFRDESSDTRNASRGAYIFEKLIFEANGPIERWHALFPSSR